MGYESEYNGKLSKADKGVAMVITSAVFDLEKERII